MQQSLSISFTAPHLLHFGTMKNLQYEQHLQCEHFVKF